MNNYVNNYFFENKCVDNEIKNIEINKRTYDVLFLYIPYL